MKGTQLTPHERMEKAKALMEFLEGQGMTGNPDALADVVSMAARGILGEYYGYFTSILNGRSFPL